MYRRSDDFISAAKLPANVLLVFWCFSMAARARRLNGATVVNGSGQYALWVIGTSNILAADLGIAVAVVTGAALLGVWGAALLWLREPRALERDAET
jgi:hypothetical protein